MPTSPTIYPSSQEALKKMGKRGGILVRIKAYLSEETSYSYRCAAIFSCCLGPVQSGSWHRWIWAVRPPAPSDLPAKPPPVWRLVQFYRGGVNLSNLRLLGRAPVSNTLITLRMALLNTRSNKTFILNDFFLSRQDWILYS